MTTTPAKPPGRTRAPAEKTTAPRALRSVKPDEPAPRKVPTTVSEAAANGTTLELLTNMRSRIARTVDDPNTMPRDLAALTKRLADLAKDIDAIKAREAQEGGAGAGPVADEAFDSSAI